MRKLPAVMAMMFALTEAIGMAAEVVETEKMLPLVQDVDVVVVGGSSGAVAAACKAAEAGAKVFLVAPRPYLGEDLAGTLRLGPDTTEDRRCGLYRRLFERHEPGAGTVSQVTPFLVKRTLDEALLKARVPFLTGAFATEPLVDGAGVLSGVVIASRSGRQAVKAKVVIDATERGLIARAAGAEALTFRPGTYTFRRRVIAGDTPRSAGLRVRELPGRYPMDLTEIKRMAALEPRPPKDLPNAIQGRLFECELDIAMPDGSERSFAAAEQEARDLTFVPSQLDSANTLFFLSPDHFRGRAASMPSWQGVDALDLRAFQPCGVEYLFVVSALADLSREAAAELLKAGNLMSVGERVGEAAARMARQRRCSARFAPRPMVPSPLPAWWWANWRYPCRDT